MSFRVEVEILEAQGVPTPDAGGQPLSSITLSVQSRLEDSQRTRQLPGKCPVWCERFVFDGCSECDVVKFTLTNHTSDKENVVGSSEFAVGGPRRQVGSKWISLGVLTAAVRVLWRVTQDLNWTISKAQDSLATVPVTIHDESAVPDEKKETAVDRKMAVENTGAASADIVNLQAVFQEQLGALEQRVQGLEELLSTRRDFDAKRRQEQLKNAGESHYGQSTFVPHPWVIASQQSAAAVRELKYDPKTQSALQSIITSPTTLSAFDDQVATYNVAAPVILPKPRLIGFVPASAPGAVRST